METKIFYNFNEAMDFAESTGRTIIQDPLETRAVGSEVTHLGKELGFDIEGFSSVEPFMKVILDTDTRWNKEEKKEEECEYAQIKYRGAVLHLLDADKRYFILHQDKNKHGLGSLVCFDASYNTFRNFYSELVAPQNIGKANKTKILNWVTYADTLESEKLSWLAERNARRVKVLDNIKSHYPDAVVSPTGKDHHPLDFNAYEVEVAPENTGIVIVWQFDACGGVYRTIKTNYRTIGQIADAIDGGLR